MDIIPDSKIVKIGKVRFEQNDLSAYRLLAAAKMYNETVKALQEKSASEFEVTKEIAKVAIYLLDRDLSLKTLNRWLAVRFLSPKKLMKQFSMTELSEWMDEVFDPILGSKKKEAKAMMDLQVKTAEILNKMDNEDLEKLLQNLPYLLAGLNQKS